MLTALSGLPGTGKTTIALHVARDVTAVYLRIDSIEQSLRRTGWPVEDEGYSVAYAIAEDNLRLVIADCVNPWPLTRREWRAVAERSRVPAIDVENERQAISAAALTQGMQRLFARQIDLASEYSALPLIEESAPATGHSALSARTGSVRLARRSWDRGRGERDGGDD